MNPPALDDKVIHIITDREQISSCIEFFRISAMKLPCLSLALAVLTLAQPYAMAADLQKGQTLYAQRCATCHGDKGAGDGPIALSLPAEQKPRNLQEGKYKFATDDNKFRELMKKGGAAVGLNMLMPAQSDLKEDDVDSLLLFVHSLKK
jgi:mono/diheme cytochrome c family protein